MKKKSLFLILTMVLMLMVSAVTVSAAPGSGTCGSGLTWTMDSNGVLTISGTGDMKDYYSYTSSYYGYEKAPWSSAKKVVINEGVTSIGDYAFYNCMYLTDITIPSTVKTVGERAFFGTKLTKVVFPEGVTFIGEYCFTENTSIKEVVLPDTLTTMGENCFYKCSNLEKMTMSKNLTEIPAYAFYNCGKLTDISMPTAPTSIGESAFAYTGLCNNLLVIPDSVTTIGESAFRSTDIVMAKLPANLKVIPDDCFYYCEALKRVEIPASVTSIGDDAFYNCDELECVYYYGTQAKWDTLSANADYELKNTPFFMLIKAGECSHMDDYVVPEVKATCTEAGKTTANICNMCGKTWSGGQKIPATGHKLSNWFMNDPEPGKQVQQVRYCLNEGCTYEEVKALSNPFVDVKKSDYFHDPVLWAFSNGVTAGTSATTFSPNNTCTRAQVVTFLWRAAGQPKAENAKNPFSDVAKGQYYYDAVLWAVENGITAGTSATTFSPDNTVQRDQFVTFLYRYAKNISEDSSTGELKKSVPFGDISSSQYYYEPVVWATQYGYCSGTGNGNFSPAGGCTRGQVVTFMHRYFGMSNIWDLTSLGLNATYKKIADKNYEDPKLTVTPFPQWAETEKVTWRSENPNIVKVSSDGTLTAVGKGTTRVWAECGNVKNYCTVEVPDVDMGWYIYSTWRDIEDATYDKIGPWAGTYMDSQGNMSAVVIFFHKYLSVGAGIQNRYYTVAYNLDTGKVIKQPADHYEEEADRYWGANKLAYMKLANEYNGLIVSSYNGNGFPMYYEKYDDLWVLK